MAVTVHTAGGLNRAGSQVCAECGASILLGAKDRHPDTRLTEGERYVVVTRNRRPVEAHLVSALREGHERATVARCRRWREP